MSDAARHGAVVLGSLNADLVVRASRAPEAGETLTGHAFHTYSGGKGANQAVGLARLGVSVALLGLTGEDSYAAMLRADLHDAGVDCDALGTAEGATGVAVITTERTGENRILIVPGANGIVTPEYIDQHRPIIARAGLLLLQLEIPLPAVAHAAEIAHAAGARVILDPAPAQPLPPSLLRNVDWLTPNHREAEALLGRDLAVADEGALHRAAEALLGLGVGNVVLKLGASGCLAATRAGLRLRVPAFRVDAVDTTAAGDAFNAGFAAALLRGLSLKEALREANAVAALSVGRRGAIPSLPLREEVQAFLASEAVEVRQG